MFTMHKISAGVLIIDGRYILAGHATGSAQRNGYDIFKGWITPLIETPIHAAIRELKEEAGIKLKKEQLVEIGQLRYQRYKDLHLFIYQSRNVKKEFPLDTLHCKSYIPFRGMPEMDGYMYVPISKINYYMYRSLVPILRKYS